MKRYLAALFVLISICTATHAQIIVKPQGGGTGICTNNAIGRSATYGIPNTPDSIMIRETHPGDFGLGYDTITLKLPTGWRFYITTLGLGSPFSADVDSLAMMAAWDSVVLYVRMRSTAFLDTFYLSGLSVVATSDSAPDGHLYAKSQQGVSGITLGPSGTDFGAFSLSPKPISGDWYLCIGANHTYTDPVGGGTWSSSNSSIITINPTTGAASAIGVGIDTITYSIDTCTIRKIISVPVCEGIRSIANNNNGIEIFPNPVTDYLTIDITQGTYQSCTITNALGQVMMQQQLNKKQTTLDLSRLSPGLYFVSLQGESGAAAFRFLKL